MKKFSHLSSTLAGVIVSLSVTSMTQAQDVQSQPSQYLSSGPQNETFEAPISLQPAAPQTSTRSPSWQDQDVALRGRDVVSYFEADQPSEGSEQYTVEWDRTTWRFASQENRDLFEQNPEKYVPQFGGYCPVSVTNHRAKIGLTDQFTVYDNRLYFNASKEARAKFGQAPNEYIYRAQLDF